ncbi:alpha/beta fold hydrolase [Scleromatobacter humisilvae]|uniref:Alpha/beta hydrolase n=1 Tax=Scleromatobacter humisilvae TaxID=2897159 RepID=A0A9X1YRA8_9BURK|nr:alpha/beta hydrolase [Scleromatobacter humisilvae]MCK9687036.1 alpha/beta hydrolase [Scleromatobacter humisilvae]
MTTRHESFVDDLALTFDDAGSGPAVLVLHGGGGPQTVARFVEAMAANARVIAPVHPGFGGTPRPGDFDSIEKLADAYAALLERLVLTEVLVVGFSIGGWIANALALRAGERLRGVVLVNGAGIVVDGEPCADVFSLTPQQLSALSYHDPARFGIDPSKLTDAQKAGMAANMRTLAVYGRARDMADPQLRARLALVRVPVLVVWGESDRVVTPAYGRAVAESFPDARLEIIAQCGHMPQIEQPRRLLELVATMP